MGEPETQDSTTGSKVGSRYGGKKSWYIHTEMQPNHDISRTSLVYKLRVFRNNKMYNNGN